VLFHARQIFAVKVIQSHEATIFLNSIHPRNWDKRKMKIIRGVLAQDKAHSLSEYSPHGVT
jgi:hypothetical protein